MAITQYAHHNNTFLKRPAPDMAEAPLDLDSVSISQLLGRDYVFFEPTNSLFMPVDPVNLSQFIEKLVHQLELTEAHTVIVSIRKSATGQAMFTRHDVTWYRHRVCHVNSLDITHPEQHEFMEMIWNCSSTPIL